MNPGLTAGEALGNRFLLVEASGLEGANPSALARERCGDGDGLLVMGSEGPEARTVEIWNRDGSAGGACLNGLRVAALWLGGEEGAFLMAGHRVDWRRIGQEVELRIPASSLPATKNFEVLQVSGLDGLRVPFWNPHAVFAVDDPDAVDPADFDAEDTYAGLGDPQWKGRICMRDETASYTQSLVASLIDLHGRERAQEIVESWVANDVQIMSNDVELLEAIDAGGCEVGISNHYYLARLLDEDPDFGVELYWASQDGAGTHVNISGAGVVAGSPSSAEAQQLLEWLATDGQSAFVDGNHELPVNPAVEPEPLVAGFGSFSRMPVDASAYGSLNAEAVEVLDAAGYR